MKIASRVFDADHHERFAAVSRDINPIHMSAVAARRTQVGAPIVHGIHTLLWLIDALAIKHSQQPAAAGLRARFRNPVYVGEPCEAEILKSTSQMLRARVTVRGTEALIVMISFEKSGREARGWSTPMDGPTICVGELTRAQEITLDELEGRAGRLVFDSSVAHVAELFPAAARWIGVRETIALVCTSSVVGMLVPGLYSIFSGLELDFFDEPSADTQALAFKVAKVEPRFRLALIDVCGGGLRGSLEAISRPPPVKQPSMAALSQRVTAGEFTGSTVMIVGGSRGLGELTAKLIAAGGGDVVITYALGEADARAVAEEIRTAGGGCRILPYDIHRAASEQLGGLEPPLPNQLYYFATPSIFKPKSAICDLRRFAELNQYYIAGFLDAVEYCAKISPGGLSVFYPSTAFVDSRPPEMTEYAMSKAAGEILCEDLHNYLPGTRVITHRLPRLPTDQTGAILQLEAADPVAEILRIVREMHSCNAGKGDGRRK